MQNDDDRKLRIMGVFAHPHDCIHTLGTCGNHVRDGDSVVFVMLTGGTATHNEQLLHELRKAPEDRDQAVLDQSSEQYVKQKEAEVRKACGYFGITDLHVFSNDDHPLRRSQEMVEGLADLISEYRPHILIGELPALLRDDRLWATPDDHTTCAEVMKEACLLAGHPRREDDRKPHTATRTYYLATERSYDNIDLYVDVSDHFENLIKAEACFESQAQSHEFAEARVTRTTGNTGWRAQVLAAEGFVRGGRIVSDRLIFTEHDHRKAGGSALDARKWLLGK